MNMRRFALLALVLAAWSALPWAAAGAHTSARLLLSHASVKPGETVWAGLQLRMDPGWHTYWRNAGESGAPTTVAWKLPPTLTPGEMLWPVPETYTSGGLTTYVYHDTVILLVPLRVADAASPGPVDVAADLRWLECEKVCVPGRGSVRGQLEIRAESKPSAEASLIDKARANLPALKPADFARAWWEGPAAGDRRPVVLDWPAPSAGALPDFFPFAGDTYSIPPAHTVLAAPAGRFRLRAIVEKISGDWPKTMAGLLVTRSSPGAKPTRADEVTVAVAETAPSETAPENIAAAHPAFPPSAPAATPGSDPTASVGLAVLLANIGLAFVGGLILNLMPCVLPVIALKILGFVNQSHGSPAEVRRLGLIYGVGVLVSLLVLAGFVVSVKGAGKAASWGMQFQNPVFVVAITTLVSLVALNLFGVFEVTLGAGTMGKAGDLAAREGSAGAFFNGVLAVILATPCSAPFLGIALGFAFAQPAHVIVLTFASVGLGLAFPYVLLSFFPRLLKFLPKPGVWMERFKNAMGFPMLATAIWLLTLTGAHYGNDGILWVGLFLVTVSVAAWIWGQFVQRGSRRKGFAAALATIVAVSGYAIALEGQLHWRSPGARTPTGTGTFSAADGIPWQPWSAQAVEQARQAGRVVFVDFTADWCITCQANKKTSIEIDSVRQRLKELNAVTLLGDFTTEDEAIAHELQKFGRAAVPLVLVYPRDASRPPIILPELLTPSIVLDALDKAAR